MSDLQTRLKTFINLALIKQTTDADLSILTDPLNVIYRNNIDEAMRRIAFSHFRYECGVSDIRYVSNDVQEERLAYHYLMIELKSLYREYCQSVERE